MEYNIINLENLKKMTIKKDGNKFFNKEKIIKYHDGDYLIDKKYLIPKSFVSNNIIFVLNGKNYWLTKIIKYNRNLDYIINLSNQDAFNLYYYFKQKNESVKKAEKIIDEFQVKQFKKWCHILLLYIDKYRKKEFSSEYILNQILLNLTGYEYDELCIDENSVLFDKISVVVNSFITKYGIDIIPSFLIKCTCNTINFINDFINVNYDLTKIINIFVSEFSSNFEKNNKIKLVKKKKHI